MYLPHLSCPPAPVLAYWSYGMVLAKSCGNRSGRTSGDSWPSELAPRKPPKARGKDKKKKSPRAEATLASVSSAFRGGFMKTHL